MLAENVISDGDLQALQIMEDLYSGWTPNSGQLEAGKALFHDNKDTLFIRWGRKGGKTDFIIKAVYRWAQLHPNSGCYYFCPQANQAREILWETNRLQKAIPRKYVRKIKENDMRILLKNGSFIKLDGSDRYEKHRGTEPHFLIYDEFKDFDRRFHEAIDPNRGVYNCPLIILGTPPVSINQDKNYEQYNELQNQCKRDSDKFFLMLPSSVNCHNIPKPLPNTPMQERIDAGMAYLKKKENELRDRGEHYRYIIEYEAKDVAQGKNAVFPMISKERHVVKFDVVIGDLRKDQHELEWYCIADPSTSTVFGLLFICLNPYSKEIFILDEIYESDRNKTSTLFLLPRVIKKMKELAPDINPELDWIKVYDEQGAWFANEAMNQIDEDMNLTFIPTEKFHNPKEDGIGLLKDCLLNDMMVITDRCTNFYWELEQYTCIDGVFPKLNDHLIDDARYFLAETNYDMIEAIKAKQEFKGTRKLLSESDLDDDLDLDYDWTMIYN